MVNEGPGYANLQSRVFFVWGSFCFVCIACKCWELQRANINHPRVSRTDSRTVVYFMIYETKGLSLEQVDELYGIVSKAYKSKAFRPAVSFQEVEHTGEGGRSMSLADHAAVQERKRSVAHVDAGNAYTEKF